MNTRLEIKVEPLRRECDLDFTSFLWKKAIKIFVVGKTARKTEKKNRKKLHRREKGVNDQNLVSSR